MQGEWVIYKHTGHYREGKMQLEQIGTLVNYLPHSTRGRLRTNAHDDLPIRP